MIPGRARLIPKQERSCAWPRSSTEKGPEQIFSPTPLFFFKIFVTHELGTE